MSPRSNVGNTTAFWVCTAVALAAITAVAATGQDSSVDKGEQIQNGACLSCHDIRPIQTTSLDKDGWTRMVASMIEKGAPLKDDEKALLIDYLVARHGPLPDGAGKAILLNTCTVCHELDRVQRQGATREEWADTLGAMINEGAMLSEQDFPVLLDYLARNFKPQ